MTPMVDSDSSEPLFQGLKVIDAASFIAAPTAAMILGDLGADVVKIEPPGDGDPYRAIHEDPAFPHSEIDHFWILDGRCKRSLTLNLKSEAGRNILLELVKECDVFITNQPFPVRRRLRLDYEDLAPLNDRMIFASLCVYFHRLGSPELKAVAQRSGQRTIASLYRGRGMLLWEGDRLDR